MKIGVNILAIRPERLAECAKLAEDLGYESLWMSDHLVFAPETRSRYPYSPDGTSPVGPATPFPDPLATLAYAAAVTTRIKLGTAVYVLPLRNPVVTAKLAATVDGLSGGRLLFGVGIGWMEEEFRIAGEPFRERIGRTVEAIAAIKALWAGPNAEHHGRYFDFGPATQEPRPVQRPNPPIIIGGEAEAALRRAAVVGDGWIGMQHTAESVAPIIARIRELRAEAGRADEPFEITVLAGAKPEVAAVLALAEVGVDRVLVYPFSRGGDPAEDLQHFADDVVSRV